MSAAESPRGSARIALRPCNGRDEWPRIVAVWRGAVEATHAFLTPADVDGYEQRMAADFLPAVTLTVATVDERIVGFSGLADGTLEMLFVDADHHGEGIGGALLRDALARVPGLRVDVNEQNPQAVGFYRRHGLRETGRSETDGEGRPFPLLHFAAPPSA